MDSNSKIPFETLEVDEKAHLDRLAQFILETLSDDPHVDLEPFEVYARQLKAHLVKDPDLFKNQFLLGYETLLDTLIL